MGNYSFGASSAQCWSSYYICIMIRRTARLQSELRRHASFRSRSAPLKIVEVFACAICKPAQEILEAKAQSFTQLNANQLQAILDPPVSAYMSFKLSEQTHTESMAKIGIWSTSASACRRKLNASQRPSG